MTTGESVALAERYRDIFTTVQRNVVGLAVTAWNGLGDWTSPDVRDTWTGRWTELTTAAVGLIADVVDNYFAVATDTSELHVEDLTGYELRGVDVDNYARRPLAVVLTGLSKGFDEESSIKAGRNRVAEMAAADVSLAQRHVADLWVGVGRIPGYRRTLTEGSCALCAVESSNQYNRTSRMPVHTHCDCGVAPVHREDPGRLINERLVGELKAKGPETWTRPYGLDSDGKLRRRNPDMTLGDELSPQIRNHGELGRVLWAPGDHFLGRKDLLPRRDAEA